MVFKSFLKLNSMLITRATEYKILYKFVYYIVYFFSIYILQKMIVCAVEVQ